MAIKTTSTKDFTPPAPNTVTAAEVETTHMVFNFSEGAGYMRQVHKDADGNVVNVRFVRVSGNGYSNVEDDILAKVQTVTNKIENGTITLQEGTNYEQVDRGEALGVVRND